MKWKNLQKLVYFYSNLKRCHQYEEGVSFRSTIQIAIGNDDSFKDVQSISKNEAWSIVSLQIAEKSRVRLVFADKSHRYLLAVSSVIRSMLFLSSCCGPVGVLDKRKFGLLSCH